MKKLSILFLTFFYLVPVIGFSVNAHYCGGKLASLTLSLKGTQECCCKVPMKKGCCTNKIQTFKISDDQQNPVQALIDNNLTPAAFTTLLFSESILISSFSKRPYKQHHPPDEGSPPLFILHRILRV